MAVNFAELPELAKKCRRRRQEERALAYTGFSLFAGIKDFCCFVVIAIGTVIV
jgi:hypothetical protein